MAQEYLEHAVEPFGQREPGLVNGPSHAREVVAWLRAQFPDLEMAIESIVADTDVVAVRIRSARTNLGLLGGLVPPTNKTFVTEQSHRYRVVDGKLCEHWATRDDLSAMLQMGVIHPLDRRKSASNAEHQAGPAQEKVIPTLYLGVRPSPTGHKPLKPAPSRGSDGLPAS